MLKRAFPDLYHIRSRQKFIDSLRLLTQKGGGIDEWIVRLYKTGILKRVLFAQERGDIYIDLEKMILEQDKKGEIQESYGGKKISGRVQANMQNIIILSAANDSDIWRGISKNTRQILERYEVGLTDISIPLSQLDNLSWIYNLEGKGIDSFSREDILEMIAVIPEILKIQL